MEKQHEEREFVLYSTIYPNMTQENHISFKEYYKGIPKRRDTRKAIEIVEDIINTYDETEWEVGM